MLKLFTFLSLIFATTATCGLTTNSNCYNSCNDLETYFFCENMQAYTNIFTNLSLELGCKNHIMCYMQACNYAYPFCRNMVADALCKDTKKVLENLNYTNVPNCSSIYRSIGSENIYEDYEINSTNSLKISYTVFIILFILL